MSVDFTKSGPKPCFICGTLLEDILDMEHRQDNPWKGMQPYYGGEVRLMFSYGSTKFDPATFKGLICDDCTKKNLVRLQRC